MKASTADDDILEFREINKITEKLSSVLAEYLKTKFGHLDYVKDIELTNILSIIDRLFNEEAAKKVFNPELQGVSDKLYNNTVAYVVAGTPFHRLPQLRYFAQKAVLFSEKTRSLLKFAQSPAVSASPQSRQNFIEDTKLLCGELSDFFTTTPKLLELAPSETLEPTSSLCKEALHGMKGSLATELKDKVLILKKEAIDKIISHINKTTQKIVSGKDQERSMILNVATQFKTKTDSSKKDDQLNNSSNDGTKNFVNQTNEKGLNLLHEAIMESNSQKVQKCLTAGADPNLKTLTVPVYPATGPKTPYRSPLCLAILDSTGGLNQTINLEIVQQLIDRGANVNTPSFKDGRTLIHHCVFKKTNRGNFSERQNVDLKLVALLLNGGCDLNASGEEFSRLINDEKNTSPLAILLKAYATKDNTTTLDF